MGAGSSQDANVTPIVAAAKLETIFEKPKQKQETIMFPMPDLNFKFCEMELPFTNITLGSTILPVEIVFHMAQYLHGYTIVTAISALNRQFAALCASSQMWSAKCAAFGPKPEYLSWKMFYICYSNPIRVSIENVYAFMLLVTKFAEKFCRVRDYRIRFVCKI